MGFKDQDIRSIFIITRLILSERFSFYVHKKGNRVKVVVKGSTIDKSLF